MPERMHPNLKKVHPQIRKRVRPLGIKTLRETVAAPHHFVTIMRKSTVPILKSIGIRWMMKNLS